MEPEVVRDASLRRALEQIDAATRTLSPDEIARAQPGRWSIAQVLEHLTLAFSAGTKAAERALASGELRARSPGARVWLLRTLVLELGRFPRAESPEAIRPRGSVAAAQALEAVREALIGLDAALARMEARFGVRKPVFNHPYLAGMNVQQWRKFHWRHTVHHMRQVRARSRGR